MKMQWCSRHKSAISPVLNWQPAFYRRLNACKDRGGCTNATSPVQLVVSYPCRSRYTGPKADGLHHTQHAVAGPTFGINCLDCGSVKSRVLQIGRALQVGCDATGAGVRSEDFDRWLDPLLTARHAWNRPILQKMQSWLKQRSRHVAHWLPGAFLCFLACMFVVVISC